MEAEIENIVFSDQKYDGDSLNFFTHENSFFSSGGKKRSDAFIFQIHIGGEDCNSYFWKQSSENNEFLPFMISSILNYIKFMKKRGQTLNL